MSGDLEFSDAYSQVFRLGKRLEELGEKPGGKKDSAGTDVKSLRQEATRLEKLLKKVEKPQSQERLDDIEQRFAGSDNVMFLVRRVLKRCTTLPQAQKFFPLLRQQVGEFGDPSGRIFRAEEVEDVCSRVTCEFSRRTLDEASDVEEGAASGDVAGKSGAGKQPAKQARKPKAKAKVKATQTKQKATGEANEDDEEDADLDGEQEIDLDVELDETEMRGLVDLFETLLQPVNDECRRAWTANLPAGSWVADDNALMGRLNKRGISLALDLMGRIPGPGQQSFNNYATARLKRKGLDINMDIPPNAECPPLQPHQQAVEFLLHEASPIERLLVDHPTGCGKTREMIAVLNSYFFDPRPKIPIFPTDSVCRNFYLELLRWPNRYRDYFCCEETTLGRRAAGLDLEIGDWKAVRGAMWTLAGIPEAELRSISTRFRECLEMSGTFVCGKLRKGRRFEFRSKNPGEEFPASPLRALGYTSAGGSNIRLDKSTGMPMSSLFKVGFGKPYSNVYDRKIILMDEVHNLVRSNTRYTGQLQTLRSKLSTAEGLVLVGFTATPIPNEKSEGRLLLDTIKGETHLGLSDEGFISSFPFKPPHLFPTSFPVGVPDVALTPEVQKELCSYVDLRGDSLLAYDLHAREPDIRGKQLRVYCNMFCFGSTFHDGKMGCKAEVMARPHEVAPKLHAIVREVASPSLGERTKALVLVRRSAGYNAMVALMREAAKTAEPPFKVATMENLSEFNSPANARGDNFLVMIAETAECGEGISFKTVRRQYITDVPETPADFIQQCGRANRMYGHQVLDPEERTLRTKVFVALLPEWLRDDALSVWCYRIFARRGISSTAAEERGRELRQQLEELRISTLDTLKITVDHFASQKLREFERASLSKRSTKLKEFKLGMHDIADFLQALGLSEVAQTLRQKRGEDGAQSSDDEGATALAAHQKAVESEDAMAKSSDLQEDAMMADESSADNVMEGQEDKGDAVDGQTLDAQTDTTSGVAPEAGEAANPVADNQKEAPILKGSNVDGLKAARLLLRSLLKLHSTSRDEVAKVAAESVQTEDQRALQHLKRLYDEFLPALCTIRNNAVDRMVLSRPEDRAMLEAAAAVKPEPISDVIKLPAIDKQLRARLEELFPEKVEDPETAETKDQKDAKAARRGRQPKAAASDPPQPTESTGDDSAHPKKGRAAKVSADSIAAAVASTATPARGRTRKAADNTATNQESQEDPVATDSKPARPLRRTKSKTTQEEAETERQSPEEAAPTDTGKARPLRRARSKVSEPTLEPPAAPQSEEVDGLACELCTFLNTLKSKRCKMCSNPLAAVAAPPQKRARAA